jgi:hypothetical protein
MSDVLERALGLQGGGIGKRESDTRLRSRTGGGSPTGPEMRLLSILPPAFFFFLLAALDELAAAAGLFFLSIDGRRRRRAVRCQPASSLLHC